MNVEYVVQRNIPASSTPNGPENIRIAMVQVKLPDGGLTQLVIREDELRFECGGDPAKEDNFIRERLAGTILAEFPGLTAIQA